MKNKIISVISVCLVIITLMSTAVSADTFDQIYQSQFKPIITDVDATPTVVEIDFTFNPLNDVDDSQVGYYIYRSQTGKKGSWTKIATLKLGATSSYKDKTVVPNKTYYYAVKAYYRFLNSTSKTDSDYSGAVRTTVNTPKFSFIGNSGYGILMKWDKMNGASGYKIYRSRTGKKGTWECIKHVKSGKAGSFTDKNVEIDGTYYYCIKAYATSNGKNYYGSSSKAEKKVITGTTTPWNVKIKATYDGIWLNYEKSYGTRGYLIYRSTTGKKGTWTKIHTTKSNNTVSYLDTTAVAGETYYYTIKSYKTLGGKNYFSSDSEKVSCVCRTGQVIIKSSEAEIVLTQPRESVDVKITVDGDVGNDVVYYEIDDENVANAEFIEWEEDEAVLRVTRTGSGETMLKVYCEKHTEAYCEIPIICEELEENPMFELS